MEPVISYGRVVLDSVCYRQHDQRYRHHSGVLESQVYEVSQLLLVSCSCVVGFVVVLVAVVKVSLVLLVVQVALVAPSVL